MSSPSGHSSLVMCDNFGQIILMLSAALLLYDFFFNILFVSESQLYQVCKTEMKGMLLRRRKELISLNCSDRYMSVICLDRYVCYLFGQICLLSVTCLDSLLPVRTGCYLFGQVCLSSVTCSDSLLSVRTGCYLFRVEECYYIFFF